MKLLIAGPRDREVSNSTFDYALRSIAARYPSLLINGGATGVDRSAVLWALRKGITIQPFPAKWDIGRRAGPERNQRMIDQGQPDLVFIFWDRVTDGSKDMRDRSIQAGMDTFEFDLKGDLLARYNMKL